MFQHWTHLRVSPSHLKRRMWTAFWVPWVSAVVTRAKVTPIHPPWARSPRSMKWGSRCTSSWTTPLVWPLPIQPRATTTTTITTTLTIRITSATVALTWMELPVHLGLWTTPVELYSTALPLGRICTSVASPNQWVPFFSATHVCSSFDCLYWFWAYRVICWYMSPDKYSESSLVIVLGSAGVQVYPAAWYGFPATPHPSKRWSPTWNFTKMVRETSKYTFILVFGSCIRLYYVKLIKKITKLKYIFYLCYIILYYIDSIV